jgi:hypothetical protein
MATLTMAQLITTRLIPRLGFLQKVEAYNHLGRHVSATTVAFPYNNWVVSVDPVFRKNGGFFTPDSIDLSTSVATISTLLPGDEITADYTFSYFTLADLQSFYQLAMSRANNTAPASSFSLDDAGTMANYPSDFEDYLTAYAYKMCLETLMVDLMNWGAALIWRDPTALTGIVQGIISGLEAYLSSQALTLKGRRFLSPKSVSTGSWRLPAYASDHNFQQYSLVGGR